jgi:hypothetical protein
MDVTCHNRGHRDLHQMSKLIFDLRTKNEENDTKNQHRYEIAELLKSVICIADSALRVVFTDQESVRVLKSNI